MRGVDMSMTGLASFDTTIHTSHVWINDVAAALSWDDKHKVFQALRMTLHMLRDSLTVDEVTNFGSQLPILIAGFYYEGWRPATTPHKQRTKKEFLAPIRDFCWEIDPEINAEQVVRTIFGVLAHRVSRGEIEDIIGILPHELKDLWSEAVPTSRS
jgi:uncharacterized protein (DUF2267 family)